MHLLIYSVQGILRGKAIKSRDCVPSIAWYICIHYLTLSLCKVAIDNDLWWCWFNLQGNWSMWVVRCTKLLRFLVLVLLEDLCYILFICKCRSARKKLPHKNTQSWAKVNYIVAPYFMLGWAFVSWASAELPPHAESFQLTSLRIDVLEAAFELLMFWWCPNWIGKWCTY